MVRRFRVEGVWRRGLSGKKLAQNGCKFLRITNLTFPDNEDGPAEEAEFFEVAFVALDISHTFILPKFGSRSGNDPAILTSVHMPEATMDENYFLMPDKHDIRMAGKDGTI
jgi:hypothetical protein